MQDWAPFSAVFTLLESSGLIKNRRDGCPGDARGRVSLR